MDKFFFKKFQEKTDQELKTILVEKENYTSEAIITAYTILKERKVDLNDFNFIKTEIETQNNKRKNSSEVQTENIKTLDSENLELFSKKTILGFSIFFSTIFGVILMMMNMQQINSQKGKNQVLLFGITYFLFTIIILQLFITSSMLGLLFNLLGAAILNEYFWNKFIGKDIIFQKKNWVKPALLCLLITFILVLILFKSF